VDSIAIAGPAETVGSSGTLTLVTVAEANAYLEKPADAGAQDALLQILIDGVSFSAFALMGGRFLKRPSTPFDVVFTPRGDGSAIWLPQWPIGTISSIQLGNIASDQTFNPTTTLIATDWYSEPRSGRVYGSFPLNVLHSVRVVWTGGYTAIPQDAKDAALQWVGVKLSRIRAARWDQSAMQKADQGASYLDECPKSALDTFLRYKSMRGSIS
jgi:hypothetical protein